MTDVSSSTGIAGGQGPRARGRLGGAASAEDSGQMLAARETSTDYVYRRLLDDICSGALTPGTKLRIQSVATEIGVSITPVREALRMLCRDGVVSERPYVGFVVSALSRTELWELFELRGVLEGFAVRKAIPLMVDADFDALRDHYERMERALQAADAVGFRTANLDFHFTLIDKAFHRGYTRDVIDAMSKNTQRYRAAGRSLNTRYYVAAQRDHLELISVCERRALDAAERLTREHALGFARELSQILSETADED